MKVCFIAPKTINMVSGGPLTQILNTSDSLKSLGVEISFFNQWDKFDNQNYDLYHVFVGTMLNYDITQRLKQFNKKFVVSSIFFTKRSPIFIRSVIKIEDFINKFYSGIRTDYGIIKQVCESSNHVLPNTNAEANLIQRGLKISADKITVITNGVDSKFLHSTPDLFVKTYGVKDFILNVGHLGSKRKNVLSLIRAVKDLNVPTVIIGKIHNNDYGNKCLYEASLNKNILIIPGLENDSEMLASAYSACKIFALPSLFETPGIAALEAAISGANIVITKFGGTFEYFKENAIYINPYNVESIRDGIIRSFNTPSNSSLTNHIKNNFLWSKVGELTLNVYDKVINS
ncbi:MAG: glycosyltransferase [Chlorobiota bacterium]|nr:glycosyltransferase [Chlorobiota bacterium]QQS67604.1 MAG: glycosyltransferase [Chlorobiota bacterium]